MPLNTPLSPATSGVDGNIVVEAKVETKQFNADVAKMVTSAKSALSGLVKGIATGLVVSLVGVFAVIKLIIGLVVGLAGALIGIIILLNRFGERLFFTFEKGIDRTSAYFKLLEQLRGQFDELRGAIFSVFATLLQAALPAIITVVTWLTKLLDLFNQVLGALLGQKTVLKGIVKSTQDQTKAEKEGALAAFDKLDVLKKQKEASVDTSGVGFVQETISDKAQSIADKIRGIFQSVRDIWNGFVKDWNNFWTNITLGKVLTALWQNFVTIWTLIWGIVKDTWEKIKLGWEEVVTGIKMILKGLLLGDWTLVFQGMIQVVKGVFDIIKAIVLGAVDVFTTWATGVVNSVKIVWSGLAPWFQEQWDKISKGFSTFLALLLLAATNNLNTLKLSLIEIFNTIVSTISVAASKVGDAWNSMWRGVADFAKSTINTIIGFVNGMIQAIVNGINSVVGAINELQFTVPSWIPGIGGQSIGFSLPTVHVPKIPQLAQGAVIPPNAQFLAVLGDQKSGNNLELPENLLRQIVREEGGGSNITIRFDGSLAELARVLKPHIDKENTRRGISLIQGNASV